MKSGIDVQIQILRWLATFKFLSVNQFYTLGLQLSKRALYSNLCALREKKMIGKRIYRYAPGFGRVEDIHFLKAAGAKFLTEFLGLKEDEIKIPRGKVKFAEQYRHRHMVINIHISIYNAFSKSNAELMWYYNYFELTKKFKKSGREGATKISALERFVIADSIFHIQKEKTPFLFCLEMHNAHRVKRLINQLKPYAYVLATGSASIKYDIPRNPKILIVTEFDSTLKSTLEAISSDPFYKNLKEYFLFKTYEDVLADPLNHRTNLNREQTSLII